MRTLIVALLVVTMIAAAALAAGVFRRSVDTPPVSIPQTGPLFAAAGHLLHDADLGVVVTRLADGRVMISGGGTTSVEIWDPATRTSTDAGELTIPRTGHLAVPLADGRVLIVGGFDATTSEPRSTATAEVYDPATASSVRTGSMRDIRGSCHCGTQLVKMIEPSALVLLDGRVMVVGGYQVAADGSQHPSTVEIWSPATDSFEDVPIACDPSRGARAVLRDGRVLVTCFTGFGRTETGTAGSGTNRAMIFDPAMDRFAATGAPTTTDAGSMTVLPDGRVLLAGDAIRAGGSPAELYDPLTGTFTPLPGTPSTAREVLTLADGRILFTGIGDVRWIVDPDDLSFRRLPDIVGYRMDAAGTPVALLDGRVLLVGGSELLVMDAAHLPGGDPVIGRPPPQRISNDSVDPDAYGDRTPRGRGPDDASFTTGWRRWGRRPVVHVRLR
jgi:hypothetical protein